MALLLLSMLTAGLGAAQAYRAQRSHQATADALLHDYGAFATWTFAERYGERLDAALGTTLDGIWSAVRNGVATEACLDRLLQAPERDCGCGVHLGGLDSWAFHATFSGSALRTFTTGEQPEAAERAGLLEAVAEHARTLQRGQRHAITTVRLGPGESRIIAYSRVPSLGSDTVVYGVEVSPDRLARVFQGTLDQPDLLPPTLTRGQRNRDLVAVRALDARGSLLWESAPGVHLTHLREQALAGALGGGVIQASVIPDAAELLIIGGLPTRRVPLLLLVFGLSGVLALLALLQLRKENAFAVQRSDFVAGVSHELRTPLAQIRLFVETLRLGRTRTPEEHEWALGTIDRETLRLARLVENVLLFSRAERGRLAHLETEVVELAEAAEAIIASFRPLLRPGKAELVVDLTPGLHVEVHRDAFRQVVINLLDNAVKYGPAGQSVTVRTRAVGEVARLTVEDEGPGVAPEERAAVWDAFRRGSRTVGSVVAGSGIGLSVVREIVEAHGGRVTIEEAAGGGARFVVALPLLRTAPASRSACDGAERAAPTAAAGAA